jgi:maltooligosyltrehalose trehalohydrolase
MHEFTVWAPLPARVDLVIGQRRLPMSGTEDGWWHLAVADAGAGADYAFSLDGGPPRPDPRSAFQPAGIDGPSRLVDHGAFAWTDSGWRGLPLAGSVLYESHVGTFSAQGTFDGAIDHLAHLADLGIDAIELMPVTEFSGRHGWGYDAVDLYAPHHAYGGPDGLKRLIDAAHSRGLGVVLDVVYNHAGPAGNYLPEFGQYFSARHRTNWGAAVNFDGPFSDEVRRFVIDNAVMWLRDYHCDGLRLDAVHAIADDSATHILESLTAEVDALSARLGRQLFVVVESDLNAPRFVRSPAAGGYGLDASWADEWHHALHAVLTGERGGYYEDFGPLPLLAKAMRQAWVYDGGYSPHRRRVHGRPPAGLSGSQFVVSAQNHDQVGNRAAGARLSALVGDGRLRIAAALLLTSPFVPMLFQGEEWGAAGPFLYFTGHEDPDLGRVVSDGRRTEFATFDWDPGSVPDPQDPATFERSKLDWAELTIQRHAGLLAWHRELIALRRQVPALTDPRLDRTVTECDASAGRLIVRRGPVAVVVNLGAANWTYPAEPAAKLLAASDPGICRVPDGVVLPPDTVALLMSPPPGAPRSQFHDRGVLPAAYVADAPRSWNVLDADGTERGEERGSKPVHQLGTAQRPVTGREGQHRGGVGQVDRRADAKHGGAGVDDRQDGLAQVAGAQQAGHRPGEPACRLASAQADHAAGGAQQDGAIPGPQHRRRPRQRRRPCQRRHPRH